MLIHCDHCNEVINNVCTECPWCNWPRVPVEGTGKRNWQISLAGILLLMTVICAWLGMTLLGPTK